MTKLYRTEAGVVVQEPGQSRGKLLARVTWDDLFAAADPAALVRSALGGASDAAIPSERILPPLVSQEVWAAGVTYFRSRDARMEESSAAGGGDFYAKVYNADRPELFFKATASRTVGSGDSVRIRADATWNVPEPELTLAINAHGKIFGYTIGNDMSSRDIEGANPLYLPQAKVYDRCCALGPAILLADRTPEPSTLVELEVRRGGDVAFAGKTELANLKRKPEELVGWLFRDNPFPAGCFLLTGTGVIPPTDFTLRSGDRVRIRIAPIGELVNTVM